MQFVVAWLQVRLCGLEFETLLIIYNYRNFNYRNFVLEPGQSLFPMKAVMFYSNSKTGV